MTRPKAYQSLTTLVLAGVLALAFSFAAPGTVNAATVHVVQNGWDLHYASPTGDGTVVTYAHYNDRLVFTRASLPYVFVNYDFEGCCVDNFDDDVLYTGPTKSSVTGGFVIRATYCFGINQCAGNWAYKYTESYTFLSDGSWTAKLDIYGPGIAPSHTYEVFWRVDYDITSGTANSADRFSGGSWVGINTEQEYQDDGANSANGNEWRQTKGSQRFNIDPLSAPLEYFDLFLAFHSNELGGAGQLSDYPAALYDNNESIARADIVQWYHGIREYTRPSGCAASGAGCTTPFIVSFTAKDTAY